MGDLYKIKKKCLEKIDSGKKQNEIIEYLHDSGVTIIESIKIVMSLYQLSLGEAKSVVASHPIWRGVAEAARPLHGDLTGQ